MFRNAVLKKLSSATAQVARGLPAQRQSPIRVGRGRSAGQPPGQKPPQALGGWSQPPSPGAAARES
eukprot:6203383-Pleurochrysis_carterae.AAC.3